MDDRQKALAVMLHETAAYYRTELPDAGVAVYWRHLKDIEPSMLQKMLDQHICDPERGRWMPTVADLLQGVTEASAGEIEQHWRQISKLSFPNREAFPVAWRALQDIGGPQRVRNSMERDLPAMRKEYVAAYKRALSASSRNQDPALGHEKTVSLGWLEAEAAKRAGGRG